MNLVLIVKRVLLRVALNNKYKILKYVKNCSIFEEVNVMSIIKAKVYIFMCVFTV